VYNYKYCTSGNSTDLGPNAAGAINIDTFEYFGPELFGKELISFSDSRLIRNYFGPRLTKDKHFYDYVKTSLYGDGSVRIDVDYISVQGDNVLLTEYFMCSVFSGENESEEKASAKFYSLSKNSNCAQS
jgi:hypothetical protein